MLLHIAHYNAYDIDFIRNLVHNVCARVCDVTMMKNRATIMPTDTTYLPFARHTLEINGYSINWYREIYGCGSFDCILST